MQTSNFKTAAKDPVLSPRVIAICNSVRPYFGVKIYKPLAPDFKDVKAVRAGEMTPAIFDANYQRKLDALDPKKVYADLVALAGPDAILLCWESVGERCHRHQTAAWLTKNGFPVSELDPSNPRQKSLGLA